MKSLMVCVMLMGCAVGVGAPQQQKEGSGPAVGSLSSAPETVDTTAYDPNNCLIEVIQTTNGPEKRIICLEQSWTPQDGVDPGPNQPDPSPEKMQVRKEETR